MLFDFVVTEVRRAWRYQAQRWAVLTPLLGLAAANNRVAAASLTTLRKLWHSRVRDLAEERWQPVVGARDAAYAHNCPPFGVFTADVTVCCNKPVVCPFCYARQYVLQPFMTLERLLYGGTDPDAKPRTDLSLVAFSTRQLLRWRTGLSEQSVGLELGPSACASICHKSRRSEVDLFSTWAGCVLHRVDIKGDAVRVRRSGLLLTSAPLPAQIPESVRSLFVYAKPTRQKLAEACAKVLCYPVGMMRAPPAETAALLKALAVERPRMLATYGAARRGVNCAIEGDADGTSTRARGRVSTGPAGVQP